MSTIDQWIKDVAANPSASASATQFLRAVAGELNAARSNADRVGAFADELAAKAAAIGDAIANDDSGPIIAPPPPPPPPTPDPVSAILGRRKRS